MLIYAVLSAAKNIIANEKYTTRNKSLNGITVIFVFIQLLLGIILFFISEKVQFVPGMLKAAGLRFYAIDHSLGMLAAVVLITVGFIRSNKAKLDKTKHARIFLFYATATLLMIIFIPWPWKHDGAGWF